MRTSGLEIWAGGDVNDVERIALLGVRKVWYPLLVSRIAPDGVAAANWSQADEELERLRNHGIEPIAMLVDSGSSSHALNKLPRFATAVALRYPWLRYFAPVDAPGETASRQKTDAAAVASLLDALEATAEAMRAIRAVIPDAQLVQTENVPKFSGTEELAAQVAFENARRWATFDLQLGTFAKNVAVRKFFRFAGAYLTHADLARYYCPPDIIALRYGNGGERFLDHRIERYEAQHLQDNGTLPYANVPASRVCIEGMAGVETLALECWERCKRPIAIVHEAYPCTVEEQLRSWHELHGGVSAARAFGADITALSISTLFGSPGAYDRRADPPRGTALASAIWAIAHKRDFDHPVLDASGWTRTISRFAFPPVFREAQVSARPGAPMAVTHRAIALAGASEPLGMAVRDECARRNIPIVVLSHELTQSTSLNELTSFLLESRTWAVIDCTGTEYLSHAWSETEDLVAPAPRYGSSLLPLACERLRARLLCFSGIDVFSGAAGRPYLESDRPDAIDRFGRSRARRESEIFERCERALIVRSGMPFSPPRLPRSPAERPRPDGLALMLQRLADGCEVHVQGDVTFSAAYAHDVVAAALDLLIDGERGTLHLANGSTTWPELLGAAASRLGFDRNGTVRERPANIGRKVLLNSERGRYLGSLDDALDHYAGFDKRRRSRGGEAWR